MKIGPISVPTYGPPRFNPPMDGPRPSDFRGRETTPAIPLAKPNPSLSRALQVAADGFELAKSAQLRLP